MKKNDLILLVSLIAVAALGFVAIFLFADIDADTVLVTVDSKEYARLSVNEDAELLIESKNGTNLLVIEGGRVYVKEASCPDKICVKSGELTALEPIVCLPNGVVVSLEEAER